MSGPDDRLDATGEALDAWEEQESEADARARWEEEHAAEIAEHESNQESESIRRTERADRPDGVRWGRTG